MQNAIQTRTKAGRDSCIEILRLLACLFVLILHNKPGTFVNGAPVFGRVFVTCLSTDAVGIFLFITGFFSFGNQSYKSRIITCLKRILLPTFVYTVFVATVYPLLLGGTVDYLSFLREFATTILTWNPIIHNAQHLWYLYLHSLIVVLFPILKLIQKRWLQKRWQKITLFGITFALMLANDCTNNTMLHCGMVPLTVLLPGCLYTLCGGVLYEERKKLQGKVLPIVLGVGSFLVINLARSVKMQSFLSVDPYRTHLYGWFTSVGFLCILSLTVAALSLKPFTNKAVNFMAGLTMGVYILHPLVAEVINTWGYKNWVIATFLDGSETMIQYLKFTFLYSISLFVVCGAVVVIIKAFLSFVSKRRVTK